MSAALHDRMEIEENGRIANGDFAAYLLPVNADIAEVDAHFVQYPDTLHNPVRAKGIGEIGVVGRAWKHRGTQALVSRGPAAGSTAR